VTNEWEKQSAQKRGGGVRPLRLDLHEAEVRYAGEPQSNLTPERIYQRRWALTVLERACDALQQDFVRSGKQRLFAELKDFLAGTSDAPPYPEVASRLGMSEPAVRVAVHRLRERYRDAIRDEIRATVEEEAEIDDEIRELFRALAE
jgi:RNA polymerase sigma-70 factor (ECF subfamily)